MKETVMELKNVWISYPDSQLSIRNIFNKNNKEPFWAVKGANFNVFKGEVFGIVGRNGSGKSTLLKLLSGLIEADKGEFIIKSKRPILLSLGVGFEAELSGIENIYLNALYLGYKKQDIDARINEIIEFSELGDFIFKPIRTYSSGMKARLGFSTAITLDPDILLIDEVLGVGDQAFQEKCRNVIMEKIMQDKTVILVTHSGSLVKSICNRVLWLHLGEQQELGETNEIISHYVEFMRGNQK